MITLENSKSGARHSRRRGWRRYSGSQKFNNPGYTVAHKRCPGGTKLVDVVNFHPVRDRSLPVSAFTARAETEKTTMQRTSRPMS